MTETTSVATPDLSPPAPAAALDGFRSTLGRLLEVTDGTIVFQPRGTTYELHLKSGDADWSGHIGKPTPAVLRVKARKVYTVPSGGTFVVPIMGTPRIVQGRVTDVLRAGGEGRIVVQAGAGVVVDMPPDDHAVDLGNGPVEVGSLVNVVCEPGAWVEPA